MRLLQCAVYSAHWGRLQRKQENLRYILDGHALVGISELHCGAAVADSILFQHHPTHQPFYHCGENLSGQAILACRKWAHGFGIGDISTEGLTWGSEVMVNGAFHVLWWIDGDIVRGFINMYLSSHGADQRAKQMSDAATWVRGFKERVRAWEARDNIQYTCEWVYGGDRNFTMSPEQRFTSSATNTWYPGSKSKGK